MIQSVLQLCCITMNFWNEVPYTRVEQGTYFTERETLSLPWPALCYHVVSLVLTL